MVLLVSFSVSAFQSAMAILNNIYKYYILHIILLCLET